MSKRGGTWVRILPPPHGCKVPTSAEVAEQSAGQGSQWQCATCGQGWEYTGFVDGLWMRVNLHGW